MSDDRSQRIEGRLATPAELGKLDQRLHRQAGHGARYEPAARHPRSRSPVVATSLTILAALAGSMLAGCSSASQPSSPPQAASTPTSVLGGSPPPTTKHRRRRAHHRTVHVPGVPAVDLPIRSLTPGTVLTRTAAVVCVSGYASSVRNVPDREKEAVYARYAVPHTPYQHEVDHLISLELGGSNAITNLWPEPYAGRWNARVKDVLENRLHDLVCTHRIRLAAAQRLIATNWIAAYRRYVSLLPGAAGGGSSGGSSSAGGYYASSYPSASTIYCADDLAWKDLSKTYLVHFATWARAHARFPGYHLHQPC
jgi:hypothetical protein